LKRPEEAEAAYRSVRLQTSDTDPGLSAAFDRCVPAGCFAEFQLSADVLRKFRNAGGGAKLTFRNAAGQEVSVAVSSKGFAPAFDALVKQ
jgi:invasion protein IalB